MSAMLKKSKKVTQFGRLCDKHPELKGERYRNHRCVGCNRERVAQWQRENKPRAREKQAAARLKLKTDTFKAYGGAKCSLCGFDNLDALCLDHTEGGGGQMRKSGAHPWGGGDLYSWLKQRGYPKEPRFRVLCFNCNAIESTQKLREKREKEWKERHGFI